MSPHPLSTTVRRTELESHPSANTAHPKLWRPVTSAYAVRDTMVQLADFPSHDASRPPCCCPSASACSNVLDTTHSTPFIECAALKCGCSPCAAGMSSAATRSKSWVHPIVTREHSHSGPSIPSI